MPTVSILNACLSYTHGQMYHDFNTSNQYRCVNTHLAEKCVASNHLCSLYLRVYVYVQQTEEQSRGSKQARAQEQAMLHSDARDKRQRRTNRTHTHTNEHYMRTNRTHTQRNGVLTAHIPTQMSITYAQVAYIHTNEHYLCTIRTHTQTNEQSSAM
jgi:hypothetical protein